MTGPGGSASGNPPGSLRGSLPSGRPVVLLDTNVLLDVVEQRATWYVDAANLLAALAAGRGIAVVAPHTIPTIYYVVKKARGAAAAQMAIADILSIAAVATMAASDFQRALALGLADYEDACQVAAALVSGATVIATRNGKDFKKGPIPVALPAHVLALLPP